LAKITSCEFGRHLFLICYSIEILSKENKKCKCPLDKKDKFFFKEKGVVVLFLICYSVEILSKGNKKCKFPLDKKDKFFSKKKVDCSFFDLLFC
jgi:hypothetical protein